MTELTKEQSDLIERFLTAQNAVEEQLQAVLGVRRGESGYGELIREYQRRNPRWSDGEWKTFESTKHYCVVSYLANWTINVQTPGGAGTDPENVNLRRASAGLPAVQIMRSKACCPSWDLRTARRTSCSEGWRRAA